MKNKYLTSEEKRKSIINLYYLIVLLILDVFTTIWVLNRDGQELNGILLYLSTILNMTIINIVILTHVIVIIILLLCILYINRKDLIERSNLYMIRGTLLIYIFVIVNNLIAIGCRLWI